MHENEDARVTEIQLPPLEMLSQEVTDFDTLEWEEIEARPGIIIELKYATKANFTKVQLYDCPRCFLRPLAAKALNKAITQLYNKGFGVIIYDCYRPTSAQEEMWSVIPDATYVTNPNKGSMHGRGLAVDIGLTDKEGRIMDMGSEFDQFSRKSHIDYYELPQEVLTRRKMLQRVMAEYGFKPIRTEWWHYSYRETWAELSDFEWACDE